MNITEMRQLQYLIVLDKWIQEQVLDFSAETSKSQEGPMLMAGDAVYWFIHIYKSHKPLQLVFLKLEMVTLS